MIVKTYQIGSVTVHIDDSFIEPDKPLPSFLRRKEYENREVRRTSSASDVSERS